MDRAGILGSLCFPSFPRFCGQVFWEAQDKDLALHCVQSYNDWMIDEWCGTAPGRYIPLIIIPLWDPAGGGGRDGAVRATRARTAFAFSENPEPLGLPDHPRPEALLGPGAGGGAGPADGRVHARRLVVDDADDLVATRPGSPTSPSVPSAPRARCWRGCSATSSSGCRA